ncbi:hypothetical protein [Sinomonas sp. P47F7]|uniref:hypothetical protein n=1 Tax=Sinomonas sp. P47F7 TaxID=3410987 RepID=UPI003BF5CE4A
MTRTGLDTAAVGSSVDMPDPDIILAQADPYGAFSRPDEVGVAVSTLHEGRALRVDVGALRGVTRVVLRWHRRIVGDTLVLGDAWERSYGDLQWQTMRPERPLPWTFLVHERSANSTWGAGVEVRGGALAFWTVDPHGFSLWLDVRSGDAPVEPGDRSIHAATVHAVFGTERPYAVQCQLASLMCSDPLLPEAPVAGANNFYYAYGKGFDAAAVVRDARIISELAGHHPVRPFGVVDDGWSADGTADGHPSSSGPWNRPRTPQFGLMSELADAVRAEGARPGIWYRPLLTKSPPAEGLRRAVDGAYSLDITHPRSLRTVAEDIARLVGWGFELVKHDFSTWDMFGRWGSAMGASVTGRSWQPANEPYAGSSWAPYDRSMTNAEAIVRFYRTIRESAGDALIIGCNVIGHLAAGLTHVQRIGDDTSGLVWERTRRVGVNTLAFRLAQHGRLFVADADCVPSTHHTGWEKNRQFLDLVARSGTALFVSVDPSTRTSQVDEDLARALKLALDGGAPGGVEPIDWLHTTTPERWRSGGQELVYDWLDPAGADPFEWAENNR